MLKAYLTQLVMDGFENKIMSKIIVNFNLHKSIVQSTNVLKTQNTQTVYHHGEQIYRNSLSPW